MSGYDRWLEAPWQEKQAEDEAFIEWCQDNDLDFEDDDNFEAWRDYLAGRAEDAAIEAAEAAAEDRWEWDYDH